MRKRDFHRTISRFITDHNLSFLQSSCSLYKDGTRVSPENSQDAYMDFYDVMLIFVIKCGRTGEGILLPWLFAQVIHIIQPIKFQVKMQLVFPMGRYMLH